MKLFKNLIFFFFIPIALIYLASKISRSNSAFVYYVQETKDGGDLLAINKLDKLVERNFLNREYYEVITYNDIGRQWVANYNKKQQVLLISGDPMSGWSCMCYATPRELKMIADRKIPVSKLHEYLKPFPWETKRLNCPTRSMDLISIF
ncbi:MAG: hypothetical protein ABIN80_05735 [Dyadobacter sp.]|uniref:hypothetical protein n=1 Tax=Dyadobacter sp. TaxID=1914288 RepID=UPI00326322DD